MECSICKQEIEKQVNPETGKVFWDQGHNAAPVNEGRCCDLCNFKVVIPARIEMMMNPNK